MAKMNYEQSIEWLENLQSGSWNFGIKRVKELLSKLGNPQDRLKCVHIAGTNGKGSVAAFLGTIMKECGYKAGVYTSPHLFDFCERIVVDGRMIERSEVASFCNMVKPKVLEQTYFEVLTALAFWYFEKKKTDIAIIETGLGGKLDATNAITPLCCVITNVSFDHTDYLGKSLDQIALEKAGIIKNKVPVVTAATGVPLQVIRAQAKWHGSNVTEITMPKEGITIGPKGEHQKINATIALKVLNELMDQGFDFDHFKVYSALLWTNIPGRLEFVDDNLLLDCAHNPAGMDTLVNFIRGHPHQKLLALFGVLRDKDYHAMADRLSQAADRIMFTVPPEPKRALSPFEIAESMPTQKIMGMESDPIQAFSKAYSQTGVSDLLVVCGSIYLVGKIKKYLLDNPLPDK
jgi:dihydrofolate synthase/folylpolyglutamate synthase